MSNQIFANSDPSISSGHHSFGPYIFAMAKDKKGFSSTYGIFRLTLSTKNSIFNHFSLGVGTPHAFPSKKLCFVNQNLAFFYNEAKSPHSIVAFNPSTMSFISDYVIDLTEAIKEYRPNAVWLDESKNNMIRIGTMSMDEKEGKLYVSVVFLDKYSFNVIGDEETEYHLAVIDMATRKFEKFIHYPNTRTVGFFVSENNPTSKSENGDLYFCSWGWNQWGKATPSKVFRIKKAETDFDKNWEFDIEKTFGAGKIAQSIISYNNKIYLHISNRSYQFNENNDNGTLEGSFMDVFELNPDNMSYKKMDIPTSESSARMNIFNIVEDKLFICVANSEKGKFNGMYSIDRGGNIKKELTIDNKYRPTRFYKLKN